MSHSTLSRRQMLARLALIGAVPLALILLFLWAGGWLSPQRLSADKLIGALEQSGGKHPGFRRNHAKGVCVVGTFTSSGDASVISRAALFAPGVTTPVTGRFAIAGGNPQAPDYAVPVRSMALQFQLADGEQWRTGMNAIPFFPVATAQGFYDQQVASRPDPSTGKPDPARIKALIQQHPEIAPFMSWAKHYVPSSSWGSDRFNSLNAFFFVDKADTRHLVRWSMVPQMPRQPITAAQKTDKQFLQEDLQQRLARAPLKWDLIITVASAGDPQDDASRAWPADRRTINAGTLTVDRAVPQLLGACNDINYDPLILPDGIAASDDPLLNARSAAYAKSYNLRTREQSEPSGHSL
ncbi:catalase family peroxidase [Cronobacter turicensis]|uniref:catalase family peroxidase n=1 Tax=Cronobacter turicensis TaxID=413502 RepID=UPI0024C25A23|nr:catalase family peroxidase [Cronobacter turicensis]MDK1182984.1 catalase family peroxidase [Cronobacter turicensis]MDK1207919.1 catalase family peroxidase [Cronobacter turicensis]MDK1215511.1 catalase family peroxidase [Cronobacter turicensis]MDK1219121.1 catalase family peroxidase [Cronobacter turicensis]MDK1231655.1 catalase family peroxidase [Cronobacter turicensis]